MNKLLRYCRYLSATGIVLCFGLAVVRWLQSNNHDGFNLKFDTWVYLLEFVMFVLYVAGFYLCLKFCSGIENGLYSAQLYSIIIVINIINIIPPALSLYDWIKYQLNPPENDILVSLLKGVLKTSAYTQKLASASSFFHYSVGLLCVALIILMVKLKKSLNIEEGDSGD